MDSGTLLAFLPEQRTMSWSNLFVQDGIALFGDLTIDQAGTGYTLTASASGATGATSALFDVIAATP